MANDLMQERLDQLLKSRPQQLNAISALDCAECGVDIPEGRRKAVPGTQHCTECSSILAQQQQFKGGY